MCPECEAPRGRYHKGPDENDDGQVIRQRECRNCGLRYPTVEVAVTGTTFYRLADEYRRVNTERMRDARNYRASQNGSYFRERDRLKVTVQVVRGRRQSEKVA
jgi:transcriptional regulator NrdR family protein